MNDNTLQFDIATREGARWLATLLSELQGKGVNFKVTQDSNLVYVTIY